MRKTSQSQLFVAMLPIQRSLHSTHPQKGIVLAAHVPHDANNPPPAPIPKGKHLHVTRPQDLQLVFGEIRQLDLPLQGKHPVHLDHQIQVIDETDGRHADIKELTPQEFETEFDRVDVGRLGGLRVPGKGLCLVVGGFVSHHVELFLEFQEGSANELGGFLGSKAADPVYFFANGVAIGKRKLEEFFREQVIDILCPAWNMVLGR